jgi:hypothetical protein
MAIAGGAEPDELIRPVLATVALIAAALAASWLSFRRQEL